MAWPLNLPGKMRQLISQDEESQSANRRRINEEGELLVETVDGEFYYVDSEDSHIDRHNQTIWISSRSIHSAPLRVHLPVEEMSAADNYEEKSEKEARLIRDVVRYSTIINPSNDPDKNIDLDIPYLEIWY